MPIYEYFCQECENKFEIKATLTEKEKGLKPECPKCHSQEAIQTFGHITVIGSTKDSFTTSPSPCCGPGAGPTCCPKK
jgi:putative FmdB family regulatory protein